MKHLRWVVLGSLAFSAVVAACVPSSRVSTEFNPDLDAHFSNLSVAPSGRMGGAVLVMENGEPVRVSKIDIDTRGSNGQWVRCAQNDNPTPLPTDTATPADTATPTTSGTATPTDSATPTPSDSATPTPVDSATPTPTDTPMQAMVVDASVVGDMSGSVANHATEIQAAVKDLGDTMLSSGTDRLGLVKVSSGASILSPLTNMVADWDNAVGTLTSTNGWTALFDGIRIGNDVVDVAPMTTTSEGFGNYKAIVVFTDGKENNSADEHGTGMGDSIDTTLDDLLHLQAQGAATAIWTVGVGDQIDEQVLQTLADSTGGQYMHIADYTQLPAALHAAHVQLHSIAATRFTPHSCDATEARITVHTAHGATQKIVKIPATCH